MADEVKTPPTDEEIAAARAVLDAAEAAKKGSMDERIRKLVASKGFKTTFDEIVAIKDEIDPNSEAHTYLHAARGTSIALMEYAERTTA
jgi:hypothetical protein